MNTLQSTGKTHQLLALKNDWLGHNLSSQLSLRRMPGPQWYPARPTSTNYPVGISRRLSDPRYSTPCGIHGPHERYLVNVLCSRKGFCGYNIQQRFVGSIINDQATVAEKHETTRYVWDGCIRKTELYRNIFFATLHLAPFRRTSLYGIFSLDEKHSTQGILSQQNVA